MTLIVAAERAEAPSWLVLLILGLLVYYLGRRVVWRLRGKDKKRVITDAEWEEVLHWWGNRCALRWIGRPGSGPFRCTPGPLKKGHQIAHSRYGPSSKRNTFPVCQAHNDAMKANSNIGWNVRKGIPVWAQLVGSRRRVWAEFLHGKLNCHVIRLRPERRRRRR